MNTDRIEFEIKERKEILLKSNTRSWRSSQWDEI